MLDRGSNTHTLTLMELSNGLPIIVHKEDKNKNNRKKKNTHPHNGIVEHFYSGTN